MKLTLDSSVIIAALRKQEPTHPQCKSLLQQVKEGKHLCFESAIVLVEVTAAIRRRTGSRELARQVRENLLRLDCLIFLELTEFRMKSAARIAERVPMRGMDSIVVQVAEEKDCVLVTLDKELAERAAEVVLVEEVEKILTGEGV